MAFPDFDQALVLTGGGTGGHFFPAVALAEGAASRWSERRIVFVGAQRGIEARKLPGTPWPHLLLDAEGFLGRSPLRVLRSGWKLWRATAVLKGLWRKQRPWAVIGTGGYGAAPALLAARSLGIPYFLHESNAAPGALVKLVAPRARRVWCGLDAVRDLLPGADCLTVGTPVRSSFLRGFSSLEVLQPPFRLLVLGGSGGARALNDALMEIAGPLLEASPDWEILHQTGPAEACRLAERALHPRHRLVPFLEHVDTALEGASLVVSRAGASTCAELRAAGRGAILVPLPTAAHDHQRRNAQALADQGRALLEPQGEGFPDRLRARCRSLMADPDTRRRLAGSPEPNRAVEACLDDLSARL